MMSRIRLTFIAAILAGPVLAQEPLAPRPDAPDKVPSLIEEGAKLLFRGLLDQLAPELEAADLPGKLALMQQLGSLLSEFEHYEAPVVLPNGDVLIRRKPGAPPPGERIETGPGGEVDL